MLEQRLTNVLFNYTSLPRKKKSLSLSDKKIESEYDEMEQRENRDCKREDRDYEGRMEAMRDKCRLIVYLLQRIRKLIEWKVVCWDTLLKLK